jgi:small-conductance mechanosensitive channel
MQTKIMEMGQPPPMQKNDPSVWVKSRQFTGRIVTVTNDKIFSEPVFNYTDQFPFVWKEISLQIHFTAMQDKAEAIMLEAARQEAVTSGGLGQAEVERLEKRYGIAVGDIDPKVYCGLVDGWIELTVRFLTPDHGTREIKDGITRAIVSGFGEAGIEVATTSYEITKLPPLRIEGGTPV